MAENVKLYSRYDSEYINFTDNQYLEMLNVTERNWDRLYRIIDLTHSDDRFKIIQPLANVFKVKRCEHCMYDISKFSFECAELHYKEKRILDDKYILQFELQVVRGDFVEHWYGMLPAYNNWEYKSFKNSSGQSGIMPIFITTPTRANFDLYKTFPNYAINRRVRLSSNVLGTDFDAPHDPNRSVVEFAELHAIVVNSTYTTAESSRPSGAQNGDPVVFLSADGMDYRFNKKGAMFLCP